MPEKTIWCVESAKYGRVDYEDKAVAEQEYKKLIDEGVSAFFREKDLEDYFDDARVKLKDVTFEEWEKHPFF